jgi:hypothetical protein
VGNGDMCKCGTYWIERLRMRDAGRVVSKPVTGPLTDQHNPAQAGDGADDLAGCFPVAAEAIAALPVIDGEARAA